MDHVLDPAAARVAAGLPHVGARGVRDAPPRLWAAVRRLRRLLPLGGRGRRRRVRDEYRRVGILLPRHQGVDQALLAGAPLPN
eukprot:1780659-Prymnesium_polylepis.1